MVEDVEADNSFGFYKWDGTQWSFVSTTTIHVTGAADLKGLKFDLGASDLGNSNGFNFFVESVDGDGSAGHFDDGPSGSGSSGSTSSSRRSGSRSLAGTHSR